MQRQEGVADNAEGRAPAGAAAPAASQTPRPSPAASAATSRRTTGTGGGAPPRRAAGAGGAAGPVCSESLVLLPATSIPARARPQPGDARRALSRGATLQSKTKLRRSGRVVQLGELEVEVYWVEEPSYGSEGGRCRRGAGPCAWGLLLSAGVRVHVAVCAVGLCGTVHACACAATSDFLPIPADLPEPPGTCRPRRTLPAARRRAARAVVRRPAQRAPPAAVHDARGAGHHVRGALRRLREAVHKHHKPRPRGCVRGAAWGCCCGVCGVARLSGIGGGGGSRRPPPPNKRSSRRVISNPRPATLLLLTATTLPGAHASPHEVMQHVEKLLLGGQGAKDQMDKLMTKPASCAPGGGGVAVAALGGRDEAGAWGLRAGPAAESVEMDWSSLDSGAPRATAAGMWGRGRGGGTRSPSDLRARRGLAGTRPSSRAARARRPSSRRHMQRNAHPPIAEPCSERPTAAPTYRHTPYARRPPGEEVVTVVDACGQQHTVDRRQALFLTCRVRLESSWGTKTCQVGRAWGGGACIRRARSCWDALWTALRGGRGPRLSGPPSCGPGCGTAPAFGLQPWPHPAPNHARPCGSESPAGLPALLVCCAARAGGARRQRGGAPVARFRSAAAAGGLHSELRGGVTTSCADGVAHTLAMWGDAAAG